MGSWRDADAPGRRSRASRAADLADLPPPSPDWQDRTAAVEKELQRRFGRTPQLSAGTEQSDRIGALLDSGQLAAQVLTVRPNRSPGAT